MSAEETMALNFIRRESRHELKLSADFFNYLNDGSRQVLGSNLIELSDSDPFLAYQYIRSAVSKMAIEKALDVSTDGLIAAHADFDQIEDVRAIARDKILGLMPAEYEGPFSLAVSVYPSHDDIQLGIVDARQTIPVMDLQIESPSSAA